MRKSKIEYKKNLHFKIKNSFCNKKTEWIKLINLHKSNIETWDLCEAICYLAWFSWERLHSTQAIETTECTQEWILLFTYLKDIINSNLDAENIFGKIKSIQKTRWIRDPRTLRK